MSEQLNALKIITGGKGFYYDLVEDIIREEMFDILVDLKNPDYDIHETKENKKKLRKSCERVLKYYSNKNQWDSAIFEIYGKDGLDKKPYYGHHKVEDSK